MALTRSFPIDEGYPTALDVRRLDAGLIVREGILADPITVAVAGIAFGDGGFNVGARPFVAALKRGGAAYSLDYGVARLANDAAGAAWTVPAAPVSNSRIDLLWIRATDPTEGEATSGTDGPGDAPRAVPIFGVTSGTAAPSPVAPALPAGAYLIATVTTPSGAASIAGSTIVQSYGFAQLSGGTAYARTLALLPTTAVEGDTAIVLGTGVHYLRSGGAWVERGFSLRETVTFISTGTFTKATYPWLRAIRVRAVGGGGGSGGCAATPAGQGAAGAGGGGGAYAESLLTNITALAASVTVTVGAGGAAGGLNGNGASGGVTSFGALVSAAAGGGGTAGGSSVPPGIFADFGTGGAKAACVGDLTVNGQSAENPWVFSAAWHSGSRGGRSLLSNDSNPGSRANGGTRSAVGGQAFGGGAGAPTSAAGMAAAAGAGGGAGIVILELFS